MKCGRNQCRPCWKRREKSHETSIKHCEARGPKNTKILKHGTNICYLCLFLFAFLSPCFYLSSVHFPCLTFFYFLSRLVSFSFLVLSLVLYCSVYIFPFVELARWLLTISKHVKAYSEIEQYDITLHNDVYVLFWLLYSNGPFFFSGFLFPCSFLFWN